MPRSMTAADASSATATCRILVADSVSEAGLRVLRDTPGFDVSVRTGMKPAALADEVSDYDALIVRSATRVTAEVLERPGRLRVIGRAGTGVDNIDLEAATRAGVVVINTPGGNAIAAAEHTLCLLLALARHVTWANADLREGRWERKKYTGVELAGKTLGVVGLGRIGREVARRALALRMTVFGYDPFVADETLAALGVVPRSLDQVIADCDFLTLHVPASRETGYLIGADALARMKPGSRLINCARGGLVDERALIQALDAGHLAGAALDVFEREPPVEFELVRHPKVVATPHLGASTVEAQERVGTEIAEKVRDFLQKGLILDAVNFPAIAREEYETVQPAMALAERLGRFAAQIVDGRVRRLEVRTYGDLGKLALKPVVMAAVKGLLEPVLSGGVSHVNALPLAAERGITVEEGRSSESTPYSGMLRLTLFTDRERTSVAGTLFGSSVLRVVEIDGLAIEASPAGHVLLFRNKDVPGVVGRVGTILGEAGVNIAGVQLGRIAPGGDAIFLVSVDGSVPPAALESLRGVPGILRVRVLKV